jgi:hypothetical protein
MLRILVVILLYLASVSSSLPALATVSTTVAENTATGNGATTSFPFTFRVFSGTDVQVLVNNVLQNSGQVQISTNDATGVGGTVLFTTAPTTGAAIVIRRAVSQTQQMAFPLQAKLDTRELERTLDKNVAMVQDVKRDVDRRTFVWRGTWSSANTYQKGEAAALSGTAYICLTPNTTSQPPSADWDTLASKGDAGATGATGAAGATGPAGAAGAAGAISQLQEEGSNLTVRSTVDFVGSGLTASDTGSKTQVAINAQLSSLADLATNGLVTRTASNTITARTITGTSNQITISNGSGASGNPTIALASDPTVPGTGAMIPPAGTTVQRPSGAAGKVRYNTTDNKLEYHNGTDWIQLDNTGGGGGSGAPTTARYVVLATNSTLTAEEVLIGTSNRITVTPSGTNGGNVTLDIGSDVVTLTGSQTLTNKTLTSPVIGTIVNTGTITLPTATTTLVGRDTTDTLTNKTLTAPVISTITVSGNTVTLPAAATTLVGRDTTDTLTNKTITSPHFASSIILDQSGGNYTLTWVNPASARALSIPDPGGSDSFVFAAATQTLTNKSISAGQINSGVLTQAVGGTGFGSFTAGDIIVVDNSGNLVKLAGGNNSDVLTYNTGTNPKVTWAAPGAGSGTVTNFSAGDLSPLFTTTEATTTTTPALSFALSNAAAHTFFGNNTGSTAAPGFQAIGAADIAGAKYDSGEQTITAAGNLVLNHGLGYVPTDVWAVLVCKIANLGYAVNDIVVAPAVMTSGSFGVAVTTTSTQLNIRFGSSAGAIAIGAKATGVYTAIVAADWKIKFYAR